MMLKKLKALLIVNVLFLNLSFAFCCGPYFGFPDDTLSFFENSVVGDPYFYSYLLRYSQPYGIEVKEDLKEKSVFDEEIPLLNEWKEYFGKNYKDKIDENSVKNMLFDDTEKNANYVKKWLKLSVKSGDISKNDAIRIINSNNDRATLEYLNFMYDINSLFSAINDRYSWEDADQSVKTKATLDLNNFLSDAKNKMKSVNEFLSLRYSYQVIKILAYLEKFEEILSFYRDNVANVKSNSIVKYRCIGYQAMAYYRTGDMENALNSYLFVFDQCPPLMETVKLSLDSMDITDKIWRDFINHDDNKSRKINSYFLWASKDERNLSFDTIEKMENLNPASSKPEILLVRSIQSLEKYNQKGDYSGFAKICERTAKLDKIRQPALWYIAGAYISYLSGKIDEAGRLYDLAVSAKTKKDVLNSQINLIGDLIEFKKNDYLLNSDIETGFIKDVNWAKGLNGDYKNNNGIYHSILAFIGNKFLEKGVLSKAAMCFLLCDGEYGFIDREVYLTDYMNSSTAQYLLDVYAADDDLGFIEDVFRDSARFDLFANFKDRSTLKLNDIVFLRGVKEFRSGNFTAASGHFKKLPAKFKEISFSRSNPEIDHKAKFEKMGIADFSDMMAKLKAGIENKKDDPSRYFELANIYYSMKMMGFPDIARRKERRWGNEGNSGYGKYHSYAFDEMVKFAKSKKYKQDKYDEFVRSADNFLKAENNYRKIIDLDKDKELSAKSCILINTCRNNYLYVPEDDSDASPLDFKNPDKNIMKYFLLFKNYKDTKFYNEFIKECPLIEEFK
jgi:hypothetical protein